MRKGRGLHIFVDMDETLLKGESLNRFGGYLFIRMEGGNHSVKAFREEIAEWDKGFEDSVEEERMEHPRASFKSGYTEGDGEVSEYESYIWNLAMEKRIGPLGWKVIWFHPDEAMAVYPRDGAKDFLTEVSRLGTMCLCSTAVRYYAEGALGEVLGVKDMFKDICTREDIYAGGYYNPSRGWDWTGKPRFLLVDDLHPFSEGIRNKMAFLGAPEEDYESRVVNAPSFGGWRSDGVLMGTVLPDLKKRIMAMGWGKK